MNAKAFVGFLCAMITIIDIIMQVLERVSTLFFNICFVIKYVHILAISGVKFLYLEG